MADTPMAGDGPRPIDTPARTDADTEVEAQVETTEGADDGERLVDRLRGSGVGTEDPNIVGDVGPTDTPPGQDPS